MHACTRTLSLLGAVVMAAPTGAQSSAQPPGQATIERHETGESLPEEVGLQDALAVLRERSPLLFAEREQIEAARGELEQAGKWPNPTFSVETEEFAAVDGPNVGRTLFLSAAQEIETAGKRHKRSLVAESLLSAARSDFRAFERALSYEVKLAHARLALSQSDVELARQNLEDFDRIVRLSRLRYERGEISGGELRRVEAERLGFLEDQVAAEIALETSRAELLGLLGIPEYARSFEVVAPERSPIELPNVEVLIARAQSFRPEVEAQENRFEAAERQNDLAEALAVPNVAPYVSYQHTRGFADVRQTYLNFGVSFGIPVWNRNQGVVARARADRRRAESLSRAARYRVAVEVRKARQTLVSEQRRVRFFEETYLETSRQARDIAEAAYRMGGETLINFLDASRVYRETLQAYNRALFDLRVARYGLELALGEELS